jgi:peptide/nickel transport system ATP-binding protein
VVIEMHLKVEGVRKDFRLRSGLLGRSSRLRAVNGVSFVVPASGSVAIVGETGSGKTTVARIIVGLEAPTGGVVEADGGVLNPQPGPDERRRRARIMQMVFQNPVMSLDPHQSIGDAIHEVVSFHRLRPPAQRDERVRELLGAVGLDVKLAPSRAHNLSGGQCQRAAIARALAAEPELLVLDEPVSALDVSTQAQILNLLADLKERLGISLLTISHDLALVRQLADNVVVMCKGEMVESGTVDAVLSQPQHPYTRRLVNAVPESVGRSMPGSGPASPVGGGSAGHHAGGT